MKPHQFGRGGREPVKIKLAACPPATMVSLRRVEASVAFQFKRQSHPQAYGDNQDYTLRSCLANYLVPY